MTGGADIDSMTEAFTQLRYALESNDAARILDASRVVREATMRVRANGEWRMNGELHDKLTDLVPLIESARLRVNLASDDVRKKLSLLADRGGSEAKITYGR